MENLLFDGEKRLLPCWDVIRLDILRDVIKQLQESYNQWTLGAQTLIGRNWGSITESLDDFKKGIQSSAVIKNLDGLLWQTIFSCPGCKSYTEVALDVTSNIISNDNVNDDNV